MNVHTGINRRKHGRVFVIVSLFLGLWLFLGSLINSHDLKDYTLLHVGVESVVERRTVALENSLSRELQPNGDVFRYKGHVYAVKQPGLPILASVYYFVMNKLGIRYLDNYLVTSAIVTFLTSSLSVAVIWLLFFVLIRKLFGDISMSGAIMISLLPVLTTPLLPYSGVLHHDVVATMLVFGSFVLLALRFYNGFAKEYELIMVLLAGLLSGLTMFVSMLPLVIVIALFVYVSLHRSFRDFVVFVLGFVIGVIPMLSFNYFVLGGALHFPNIMGNAVDTYPVLSISRVFGGFMQYMLRPGLSVIAFSPLVLVASYGLVLLMKSRYRLEAIVVVSIIVLFFIHISSIQTVGHSQYGPRYLMPIMPFWYIGIVGLWSERCRVCPLLRSIIVPLSIFSFFVFLLGSLWGSMYPDIDKYPLLEYVYRMKSLPEFPMFTLFF